MLEQIVVQEQLNHRLMKELLFEVPLVERPGDVNMCLVCVCLCEVLHHVVVVTVEGVGRLVFSD